MKDKLTDMQRARSDAALAKHQAASAIEAAVAQQKIYRYNDITVHKQLNHVRL